jgi:hypothetical protein
MSTIAPPNEIMVSSPGDAKTSQLWPLRATFAAREHTLDFAVYQNIGPVAASTDPDLS